MKRFFIVLCIFLLLIGLLYAFFFKKAFTPRSVQTSFSSSISGSTSSSKVHISNGSVPNIPFVLPPGFVVHTFAHGLGDPRDLLFTSGGTLLVSDPNANDVYALPDVNHNGTANNKKIIISGENHVHGLAFYNGKLYIADVDKVVRYTWNEKTLTATKDKDLFSLPENQDHNNRIIVFNNSGQMFVNVGSTCNVCHEGSNLSATVITADADGNNMHVFAKGLRNAAFLAINPKTGEFWSTGMGRDYLGDNTPPDRIDILRENQDYGWPYCYGDKIHDNNFDPKNTHSCNNTISPIYQISAHSAPLGLVFISSSQFPQDWQGDLLVAYHGSWNRTTPIGYKIVHLKVNGNTITTSEDFMTGFLPAGAVNGPSDAYARPVDVAFDTLGNLYVSDDKAGNIYIVQKQ